ncbi:MAG: alpha/beta hydrolase [Myxococcota bacterium]
MPDSLFTVHRSAVSDPGSSGAPQVWLLHGVFTDHRLWDPVLPALHGLDVVRLDAPGHGEAALDREMPSLMDQVDDLAELIRARARHPVVLAGHSWGGMLGLRLAAAKPDVLAGLVLTNTPLRRNSGTSRLGFRAQQLLLWAGFPLGSYGRIAARSMYGHEYQRTHPEVLDTTASTLKRLGRRGARSTLQRVLLEPEDAIDLLAGLKVPVTLHAGVDDYAGNDQVRALASTAGHPIHHHEGGHMGPAEAPLHLAEAIRGMVQALNPEGSRLSVLEQ